MKRRAVSISIVSALFLFCIALIYANYPGASLPADTSADKILVEKNRRRLSLLKNGQVLKTYSIALGREPLGHKIQEGDDKTPEGTFKIDYRNPKSNYHLALHISYPDEAAISKAREMRVSAGGDIMIHGLRNGFGWIGRLHRTFDWTHGCIAVTNEEIKEIGQCIADGTLIEITP